jgi:hypothetical protein
LHWHIAAPDAEHPISQDFRKYLGILAAPSPGRDSAKSPGLLARDQVACSMQAASKDHEAQHGFEIMTFAPIVNSSTLGELAYGRSIRLGLR